MKKPIASNYNDFSETKRLLNLAIEHLHGDCTCCQNYKTCKDKRGSHKYCWKWLYQQEYDEVRRNEPIRCGADMREDVE